MWGKDKLFHSSFQIIHHLFPLGARFIGRIARGWLVSLGWIVCKWLFCLCGIVWKNMMEMGRGGACVPARVALQGRIHRSFPTHNACIFGMETPLPGRSGGHAGTAPTVSFEQIACGQLVTFGWITRGTVDVIWEDCAWTVDAVLGIAHRWLVSFEWIAWKNMMEIGRGGACVPARVALQGRIHRSRPCTMRVFSQVKRRYADVRAGTQAPPLRVLECAGGVNCAPRCRCSRRPSRA